MAAKPSKQARRESARRAARSKQRIRWATLAAAVLLGVGTFVVLGGGSTDRAAAIAVDFELETNTGELVRLSDYRGQPVALTFMHTY